MVHRELSQADRNNGKNYLPPPHPCLQDRVVCDCIKTLKDTEERGLFPTTPSSNEPPREQRLLVGQVMDDQLPEPHFAVEMIPYKGTAGDKLL